MYMPKQHKKKWEIPQLHILDSPNAKTHLIVHEKTGIQNGKYFSTPKGSQGFYGTKNQAAS